MPLLVVLDVSPDFPAKRACRSPRQLWGQLDACGGGAPVGHGCVRPDGVCQNAWKVGRTHASDHPEPETPGCQQDGRAEAGQKSRSSSSSTASVTGRRPTKHCPPKAPCGLAVQGQLPGPGIPVSRPRRGVREAVLEYRIVKTAGDEP